MMVTRLAWCGVVAVFAAGTAWANPVSMDEAAEGWIALFDGESLFGWDTAGDAEWTASDGSLRCRDGAGGMAFTSTIFQDFELTFRVRLSPEAKAMAAVRASCEGHWSANGSAVLVIETGRGNANEWREFRITAEGGAVSSQERVDGAWGEAQSIAPGNLAAKGHIAFLYGSEGSRLQIENVKLRPLNMTAIFDGESLEGWDIIPGRASEFSVVDGALNIKDGNGQIETADTYKDFLFQIAVISHGEHLNSGVFFRGPKGVFWRGYESQVRNEWAGDDRTKPVDFGTGGIYGRQPARKVVSTDGEYFYKTIVCSENRIGVWINGYQVSNLVDLLPVQEDGNAKAGYVPEAGTIHLQGHDPTTDLSFKDMRIQAYTD